MIDTTTHAAATLTGGNIPAHEPGAYPPLSCCGGPVQLVDPRRDPTCAERLPGHLAGRLDDLRRILARDDPYAPGPDDIDEPGPLDEYALGESVSYAVRVDLSTGGPADYITATVGPDGVERATYHFADWFDHAERNLDGDELETIAAYLDALGLTDGPTLALTIGSQR